MIVCFKCRVEMRCEVNGVDCVYGDTHVYRGDLFRCPSCLAEIVRCANSPIHKPKSEQDMARTIVMKDQ